MADREDQRAKLVPRAARALRSRDWRSTLTKAAGQSDRHTVVVALPDDPMGYVLARLDEAGGAGVVALERGEDLELAVLWPASPARAQVAAEDDTLAVVHDDSPVSMFFDLLRIDGMAVVSRHAARIIDQCSPA